MQVTPDEFARLLDAAVLPAPPNRTVTLAASEIRDFVLYNQPVNGQFEKGFLEKLRRLRFHRLLLPTTADWGALFDVWVKQCCFLEADYPGENVRVSVESEVLQDVGTLSRWFLHWDPVSDSTSTGSPSTTTPKKVCMCIAIRVPDAQVPWTEFTHPSMDCAHALRSSLLPPTHPVRAFVSKLLKECEAEHCQHALVADATHTMRIQFTERALDPALGGRPFVAYQMIPAATHSAPYYVAAIVSKYSRTFGLRSARWRAAGPVSAGNDDSNKRLRIDWQQRFRDWDVCELERDRALYERFLVWKAAQHAEALANPLLPGTVLSVERDVIPRKLTPLRCPFAWVPVPDDCTASISPRRPRCQQVVDLLASNDPLVFRLTRDLREEDGAAVPSEDDDEWEEEEDSEDEEEEEEEAETLYSLVWTGQLGSALSGEFVETELCVKLFDERLFPVPALWQYDRDRSGRGGLYSLAFADELLRREETVYARFSGNENETCPHLQGLSLPHCYGFHEFTVQEGPGRSRTMLGVLMERIVGVHVQDLLYDVFKKGSQWQRDEKVRLLKRLRNLVRILNHAHITHGRWDGAEVLCMRDTPCQWDFVLIDFAFASHHDGLRVAAGYGNDVGCLQGLLVESGIDFDVLSAVAWCEKDAWEQ